MAYVCGLKIEDKLSVSLGPPTTTCQVFVYPDIASLFNNNSSIWAQAFLKQRLLVQDHLNYALKKLRHQKTPLIMKPGMIFTESSQIQEIPRKILYLGPYAPQKHPTSSAPFFDYTVSFSGVVAWSVSLDESSLYLVFLMDETALACAGCRADSLRQGTLCKAQK